MARARAGAGDALLPHRAVPAVGMGEADGDDRVAPAIGGRFPDGARLPLRAGGVLALPVDAELRGGEALVGAGLPAVVAVDRAEEGALVIRLAAEEVVCGH